MRRSMLERLGPPLARDPARKWCPDDGTLQDS